MSISNFPDQSLLLNVEELSNCLENITLLDLRPTDDFALGHIPGAKHIDISGTVLMILLKNLWRLFYLFLMSFLAHGAFKRKSPWSFMITRAESVRQGQFGYF